ncbi:MAG: sigma-70 family RNA polymerase sigma factor [Deltaproteobacteria bacterium]|nr:MAG: sigma-70 family RNA polymerase sigma factor [Deltaproteobacteria bacterium]
MYREHGMCQEQQKKQSYKQKKKEERRATDVVVFVDMDNLESPQSLPQEQFCKWVALYEPDVQRFFRYVQGLNEDMVEELTHQTFVTAWCAFPRFQRRSCVKTWLLGIARNIARQTYRTNSRKFISEEMAEELRKSIQLRRSLHTSPEHLLEEKQARERLHAIVQSLSPKSRTAFVLRYFQQMTINEMSLMLGEPRETLRSRLRVARAEVKIQWDSMNPGEGSV